MYSYLILMLHRYSFKKLLNNNNNNNNNNRLVKLKFDQITKWYMHKTEFVLENEIHKIPFDFEIQTDPLIPVRRPDLVVINR